MSTRAGIVFNPSARGNKAQRFLAAVRELSPGCELFPTRGAGSAAELAAQACQKGHTTVIAAGGDGTVSEVVDGIASVPGALQAVRVGVIPLGTINVFARELGIPRRLQDAWRTITAGHEIRVDLPEVEAKDVRAATPRRFVQLAGCGLDSRAIAAVSWEWKQRVGPLAYLAAVVEARRGPQPRIRVSAAGQTLEGELVLVGNGRLYGGQVTTFPQASVRDGVLDVRVFPRITFTTLCQFTAAWLHRRPLDDPRIASLQANRIELISASPVPVEVDGDNIGFLPATFTVRRELLRVLVPHLPPPGDALPQPFRP